MRERKKSDASSLHIDSSRRGHFIDFRITFHVAQLAEFSGCVTAEKDFFSGGVWTTRKAQAPKVVVLEVPSKLPPPELGKIKAPQPAHCLASLTRSSVCLLPPVGFHCVAAEQLGSE